MKRRVIKKNINRFITPLIKHLPRTVYYGNEIVDGDKVMVIQKQHIIVNGKKKAEGERHFRCDNLLLNIRRTADAVKDVINNHQRILLRLGPEVKGNYIRIRLITE